MDKKTVRWAIGLLVTTAIVIWFEIEREERARLDNRPLLVLDAPLKTHLFCTTTFQMRIPGISVDTLHPGDPGTQSNPLNIVVPKVVPETLYCETRLKNLGKHPARIFIFAIGDTCSSLPVIRRKLLEVRDSTIEGFSTERIIELPEGDTVTYKTKQYIGCYGFDQIFTIHVFALYEDDAKYLYDSYYRIAYKVTYPPDRLFMYHVLDEAKDFHVYSQSESDRLRKALGIWVGKLPQQQNTQRE